MGHCFTAPSREETVWVQVEGKTDFLWVGDPYWIIEYLQKEGIIDQDKDWSKLKGKTPPEDSPFAQVAIPEDARHKCVVNYHKVIVSLY